MVKIVHNMQKLCKYTELYSFFAECLYALKKVSSKRRYLESFMQEFCPLKRREHLPS